MDIKQADFTSLEPGFIEPGLLGHTADIVSAFVSHSHVPAAELPAIIASVGAALRQLVEPGTPVATAEEVAKPSPAQIKKSIGQDGLVSFIDGKAYKTLKRHLSKFGLTPESYRERFGLPLDYPMTAPAYSEKRSALAKSLGLGLPRSAEPAAPAPAPRGRKAA